MTEEDKKEEFGAWCMFVSIKLEKKRSEEHLIRKRINMGRNDKQESDKDLEA